MKTNKILLITQTALMYVSMLLAYILIIIMMPADSNNSEIVLRTLLISSISIIGICLLLAFPIFVLSIITIFKKEIVDSTKLIMILKLALIPWYIANFVLWGLLVAGMFNPFLMIGIPIVITISAIGTYVLMFSSSIVNVCTIIGELKNKTLKPSGLLIAGMVLQFFFCLDALGAVFTYIVCNKKQ